MKKVKINLAKSAGFCFGVERAIKIALQTARLNSRIEMLGDIVHNEDVVKDIKKAGIKKVKILNAGKNKILLIRAHGTSLKTFKRAKKSGYKIIDATCPMVCEIHEIAMKMEKDRREVIIIGDKKHAEVQGIIGHLKLKPIVISSKKNIDPDRLKKIKKACVVAQSTQNMEKTKEIFKALKAYVKDLEIFNTICNPTRRKQSEIKSMPLKNNLMIIIGSKNSANTKRLYQISKSLNKKSYWVQSRKNLSKEWFKNIKRVGVTAGASTPNYTIKEVIKKIQSLFL